MTKKSKKPKSRLRYRPKKSFKTFLFLFYKFPLQKVSKEGSREREETVKKYVFPAYHIPMIGIEISVSLKGRRQL